jgi:Ca2+-binding EF-hand superfamily protein
MKKLILSLAVTSLLISCKSNQESTETVSKQARIVEVKGERHNPEEMFAQMDSNNDGKLSKDEVKGPLNEKFSEIDSNSDGFISKNELTNAPKPERQGGGQGRR